MNADQINAKIYLGRGKAALRLGQVYQLWRPTSASNPLTYNVTQLNAAFNAGDNAYKSPNMPGDAYWFGDFDGNQTQQGDYLIRTGQTYYIAGQQPLLPIVCVECNATVVITRAPDTSASVGAVSYSGMCANPAESVAAIGSTTPSFVGWPCSILFGKGGSRNSKSLPSGLTEQVGWQILLPPSLPVNVKTSDRVVDDMGRIFMVSAAEKTDFGWRLMTIEVHP